MSMDPMGPIDGPNLYTYCYNDPVNWVDPLGLWGWKGWTGMVLTGAGGALILGGGSAPLGAGLMLLGGALTLSDIADQGDVIDKGREKLEESLGDYFDRINEELKK